MWKFVLQESTRLRHISKEYGFRDFFRRKTPRSGKYFLNPDSEAFSVRRLWAVVSRRTCSRCF